MRQRSSCPRSGNSAISVAATIGAHARFGPQTPFDSLRLGIRFDQGGHQRLDLGNPAIEQRDQADDVGTRLPADGRMEARGFLPTDLDELAAARRLGLESALRCR